jgi:hypothetical protein
MTRTSISAGGSLFTAWPSSRMHLRPSIKRSPSNPMTRTPTLVGVLSWWRQATWTAHSLEQHPDMAVVADWRLVSLAELPALVAGVNRSER